MSKVDRWLPIYVEFLPLHWFAAWSAPDRTRGETTWQALRITLRTGEYHEKPWKVLKKGIVA